MALQVTEETEDGKHIEARLQRLESTRSPWTAAVLVVGALGFAALGLHFDNTWCGVAAALLVVML